MPAPPQPTSLPSTSSSDPASKNTCERPRGHELGTWTSCFATRQPPCLPDGRPDLQRSFQFQYFPHITTVAYIPRPLNAHPICRRSFSTEPASHSSDQSAPITTFAGGGTSYLIPSPRRLKQSRNSYSSHLPLTFCENRLLPVAGFVRMLLEPIVSKFNPPVRYAFAYGLGVFEQDGHSPAEKPITDFIFAVDHP